MIIIIKLLKKQLIIAGKNRTPFFIGTAGVGMYIVGTKNVLQVKKTQFTLFLPLKLKRASLATICFPLSLVANIN